ncbi:hypothetical protein NKH77_05015 [Streptomyces sp. M19]
MADDLTMPDGFVDATGLGVTPDDGGDDTSALNDAVATVRDQGKGCGCPPGRTTSPGTSN